MPQNQDSRDEKARYRVVWLPPKPAPNACRHLVELDAKGRVLRFLKQTHQNLLRAVNREEAFLDRETNRRIRRWIRHMKSLGFYRAN